MSSEIDQLRQDRADFAAAIVKAENAAAWGRYEIEATGCPWCDAEADKVPHKPDCIVLRAKLAAPASAS